MSEYLNKNNKFQIMMELSENVSYMKLLHELKGDFPNMADDFIHQCIKQVSQFLKSKFDGMFS